MENQGHTCAIPKCEGPYFSKGFCRRHYERQRKYGDAEAPVRKPGPPRHECSVPGCDSRCVGQGLCDMHYRRMRKYGDPLVTKRIIGDDEARWWSHVDRRGDDECWPWTASLDEDGYGRFWDGISIGYAPRWGYERFVGPIRDKHMPDHTCHDPKVCKVPHQQCPHRACCNYNHLEPVTNRENVLRGTHTKLSDETVAVLHALHYRDGMSLQGLADTAGVDRGTLYRRFRRMEGRPTR